MITGGATGMGASMVECFSEQGANVGFIDYDADGADKLLNDLEAKGLQRPWFRKVDVTDIEALKSAFADFSTAHGDITVLVNNVANDERHDPLDVTPEFWRKCLSVNLDSGFFACQAAIPGMQRAGGGSIINLSSINALFGPTSMPGYVAAKSALIGLTKAMAREYGVDSIRVNVVLPGWVVTQRQLEKWLTPEEEAGWMESVALKERILPRDASNLIMFLAADDSRMITSQSFIIDGGRT